MSNKVVELLRECIHILSNNNCNNKSKLEMLRRELKSCGCEIDKMDIAHLNKMLDKYDDEVVEIKKSPYSFIPPPEMLGEDSEVPPSPPSLPPPSLPSSHSPCSPSYNWDVCWVVVLIVVIVVYVYI